MCHLRFRIVTVFIFLFMSLFAQAQVKQVKKADRYFYDYNYHKAIDLYADIEREGDSLYYVRCRLGDCYRHLGEVQKAVEWYLKAKDLPQVDRSTFYLLAQELKKSGRYEEADQYLKTYISMSEEAGEEVDMEGTLLLTKLVRDSMNFKIFPLQINSEFSEIGPVIHNNQLVFCSNRSTLSPIKRKDIRDGSGFYKIYASKGSGFVNFDPPGILSSNLSSRYNDGPVAFNTSNSIAFITRNHYSSDLKRNLLNIYISHKDEDEQWKKSASLIPLIRKEGASYMHAFVTRGDEGVYFVSDMEGGYGGLDIYYSEYRNGFLTKAVNLGPEVNSDRNEMFPYVDSEGRLFYASDKPMGLGGLDIYYCMPGSDGYYQSFNMGYPINTSSDDFGIFVLEDGLSGYFVSNRPGGQGEDDIYAYQQEKDFEFIRYEGKVISEKLQLPVNEATINIYEGSKILFSIKTNAEGEFEFYTKNIDNLIFEVNKRLFDNFRNNLSQISEKRADGLYINVELNEQ